MNRLIKYGCALFIIIILTSCNTKTHDYDWHFSGHTHNVELFKSEENVKKKEG